MDKRGLHRERLLKILGLAQTFNECLDRSDVFNAFFLHPLADLGPPGRESRNHLLEDIEISVHCLVRLLQSLTRDRIELKWIRFIGHQFLLASFRSPNIARPRWALHLSSGSMVAAATPSDLGQDGGLTVKSGQRAN